MKGGRIRAFLMLALFLASTLIITFHVQPVKAEQTWTIDFRTLMHADESRETDLTKPTKWFSPEGTLPTLYEETETYSVFSMELIYQTVRVPSANLFYILVDSSIYSNIITSLNQYIEEAKELYISNLSSL